MDELERLLIERACTRLSLDYARLVDFGEAARVTDLFSEDGVCQLTAGRMEGRAAIKDFFDRRQATQNVVSRHVCTNITVDVVDSDRATGVVYLTFYRVEHDGDGDAPLGKPNYVG